MTFLARFWPYLAIAAALVVLWFIHENDVARYAGLQTNFANYKTMVAKENAKAERTAREALQVQIDRSAAADRHNQGIIDDLSKRASTAESDRDFARRLLAHLRASAVPATAGHPEPAAPGEPATAAAAEASGDRSLIEDLGSAAGECRDAINTLIALQDQVRPQL
jgi:hypothetical protein